MELAQAGINFREIRPLNGDQREGFEELSVSLFRAQYGKLVRRVNGAGGDGGVEAYVNHSEIGLVGLQAKYFIDTLTDHQFRQLKKSIKSAVTNHPELKLYIVTVPQNRTPARNRHWDTLVEETKEAYPDLTLEWCGASELIELLTTVEHAARRAYWFETPRFDHKWVTGHSLASIGSLDTRYTPARHVDVEAGEALSAFANNIDFTDKYYYQARTFWKAWIKKFEGLVGTEFDNDKFSSFNAAVTSVRMLGESCLPCLGDNVTLPSWPELNDALVALSDALRELERQLDDVVEPSDERYGIENRPGRRAFEKVQEVEYELYGFTSFIEKFECAGFSRLLLAGEAGSGKSHTLARSTEQLLDEGHHVLFVLGEFFTELRDPWQQLVGMLDWPGTVEELLAALQFSAEASGKRSLIIIDALNESGDRRIWQNHLSRFATRIEGYSNVGIAVSCRTDFIELTLPRDLVERRDPKWAHWTHVGYGGSTYAAIVEYFKEYSIQSRDFPPLYPEFSNPLFLKTFCEAFEHGKIPSGSLSLDEVMKRRINASCQQISKAIDCPTDIVESAIVAFARMASVKTGFRVPRSEVRTMTAGLHASIGESRSLYKHLVSCGILAEVGSRSEMGGTEIFVRFSYERFSDYFAAIQLLKQWEHEGGGDITDQVREAFASKDTYWENRGAARILAILIPERYGMEFLSLSSSDAPKRLLLEDFLDSLLWRRPSNFSQDSLAYYEEASGFEFRDKAFETRISLACIPAHPLNAENWHNSLKSLSVADRDDAWTIQVTDGFDDSRSDLFIKWLQDSEHHPLSLEQLRLAGLLLSWFFTSNDRGFRRRAIVAASKLLSGNASVVIEIIEAQADCNDPYVTEGVMAVAAAVAVREKDKLQLQSLAECVYRRVFAPEQVYPHILVRDYAYIVLTVAERKGVLPSDVECSQYSPPYRSTWPVIPSDDDLEALDRDRNWSMITSSIEPEYRGESIGGYGDFGRYVMDSHVHHWLSSKLSEPYPDNREGRWGFSGAIARRYILNRVAELGWTPERFHSYDQGLSRGRLNAGDEEWKVERISKKYQWIALSEFEAYLSDHYHFGEHYSARKNCYEGAWQLYSRDFDTTAPLVDPTIERNSQQVNKSKHWWVKYPDPFADVQLVGDRSAWVRQYPQNIDGMLKLESEDRSYPGEWLLLYGATGWDEPDTFPPRDVEFGDLRMFIHTRAWLVDKSGLRASLDALSQRNFFGSGISVPGIARMCLYDYPYGTPHQEVREHCRTEDHFGDHMSPFPAGLIHTTSQYDEGHIKLPSPRMIELLGLSWKPDSYEFVDSSGETIAFQYAKYAYGGSAPCLVRMDRLQEVMQREGLALVWGSTGERDCYSRDPIGRSKPADAALNFSMLHWLDDDGTIKGGLSMTELLEYKDPEKHGGSYPRTEKIHPIELPEVETTSNK